MPIYRTVWYDGVYDEIFTIKWNCGIVTVEINSPDYKMADYDRLRRFASDYRWNPSMEDTESGFVKVGDL